MLVTVNSEQMPNYVGQKKQKKIRKAVSVSFEALTILNAGAYTVLVIYEIETIVGSAFEIVFACFVLLFPFLLLQAGFLLVRRVILATARRSRRLG